MDSARGEEFARLVGVPEDEIDLARAALVIATANYPQLDVDRQLGLLDALAAGGRPLLGGERDPLFCANTLSQYLFDELGFRGNQEDYYDPRNSFLNEVLSRRLGIPITLSLLYIEVGKRLDVPLVGVGMPGHFLVRHREVADLFVDPFSGGILLSVEECAERLRQAAGRPVPWDPAHLAPLGHRDFIARMLRNLKAIYVQPEDYHRALDIVDLLVTLLPGSPEERRDRGLIHYLLGHYPEALVDLKDYVASAPANPDLKAVQALVSRLKGLVGL